MEIEITADGILHIGSFMAVTIGILVLFIGRKINSMSSLLRELSIPEPVTGGILFSLLFLLIYATTSIQVEFNLTARNILLVYFFTTIGINANIKDLLKGGLPLIILLPICAVIDFLLKFILIEFFKFVVLINPAKKNLFQRVYMILQYLKKDGIASLKKQLK